MNENSKYRIIAAVLLVLFLSFQGARMFCYHTHTFGNTVISHSHPFNNPDRQHSNSELEAFAMIAMSSLTDDSSSEPLMPVAAVVPVERAAGKCGSTRLGFVHALKGRDPPAFTAI